jgi:AcrR family transcriptional regulator
LGTETLIWSRPERGARGPRPTHTRTTIAAAAVHIADTEGVEAVSMRRVAAHIGAGAASLYRYVSTKDDLYDLMLDAVAAEDAPLARTGDLRTDLAALAHRQRTGVLRHPWVATLSGLRPSFGPNTLRSMESAAALIDGHDLTANETLLTIETLTAFVTGYVHAELAEHEANRRSGMTVDQWTEARAEYGRTIIGNPDFPTLTRIMTEATAPLAEDSFEQGLARVLDGLVAARTTRCSR